MRALVKQEKAQAKLEAKQKKKGVQVNGPVLPPRMPPLHRSPESARCGGRPDGRGAGHPNSAWGRLPGDGC